MSEKTLMDFVKEAKSQITEVEASDVVALLDEGGNLIEQSEFEYIATLEPEAQIQKTPAQGVTPQ